MPKELNGLSDRVLSHRFLVGEEFPHKYKQEDRAVKKVWEGTGLN